ncbi:PAS domain-containing protein [bacterium]|nr:PAS domain-containing protein [candidate division CSSED10-310 bacterium]
MNSGNRLEKLSKNQLVQYLKQALDRISHLEKEIEGLSTDEGTRMAREDRSRYLLENMREVYWLTDWVHNKVLYVSPSYETVWDRSCQSLYDVPGSWADAVHPEDRERIYDSFVYNMPGGKYDEEYRIVRRDGSIRWIHDRAFPRRDKEGNIITVTGISEDITDRIHVERELLENKNQLEILRKTGISDLVETLYGPDSTEAGDWHFTELSEKEKKRFRNLIKKLKKLDDFIMICSCCKKILEEDGSWRQFENYIQEHTSIRFSHGICPDCMERYYARYRK